MSERVCPQTEKACEHIAACNLINQCNMPVPISEFAKANPELMAKLMVELEAGRLVLS